MNCRDRIRKSFSGTGIRKPASVALRLSVLVFLVFLCLSGKAQDKWTEKAEVCFQEGRVEKAIEYFSWSNRKKENTVALRGLGKCYRATFDYVRSEQVYRKLVEGPEVSEKDHFYFAQALLANGNYDTAFVHFRAYADMRPDDPRAVDFGDYGNLIELPGSRPTAYQITSLPVNGPVSDFSPMFFEKGIIFSSSRNNALGVIHTSTIDGAPLTDLWYAEKDTAGEWTKPRAFSDLNTRFNEGPGIVDTTRGIMYFTRNDPKHKLAGKKEHPINQLRIYTAIREDEKWVETGGLPWNSPKYAIGHPALGPDGSLYFASDMPGGYGGTDIWMARRQGESWGQPQNLGPKINTSGEELFPFMQADGTLWFASDGHLGLGGLDIFFVRKMPNDNWGRITNPFTPINSHADDFGYISDAEGKEGYFTSSREGSDDIYSFLRLIPDFDCEPQKENNYCFRFWETGSWDLEADTLPLIYEWDFGDGTKAFGLEAHHCFEGPGEYLVQLNLIDTTAGYVFMNEATYELPIVDHEQVFITGPDTVALGREVLFHARNSNLADCDFEEYYWDMGNGMALGEDEIIQVFNAPGRHEIRLGVTGYDEGMGSACKACVSREILVMEPDLLAAVRDSIAHAREQQFLQKQDSIRLAQIATNKIRSVKDSVEAVYRVQVTESKEPLDPRSFTDLGEVQELKVGDLFKYLYGAERSPEDIFPKYKEAHDKGFDEAIVVAFRDSIPISGHDSTFYARNPFKINRKGITIFTGIVRDAEGNPLMAQITLEDLISGMKLFVIESDSTGEFRIELANGYLFGYAVEKMDYYPVSNFIDLRNANRDRPEIVVREEITMHTIEQVVEQGMTIRINNIFFDFDSYRLRKESYSELDRLARILHVHSLLNVEIMGHTDNWGSDEYNIRLSRNRANSVLRYLILKGFDTKKFTAKGYGEHRPIAPNDSPESRQLNRRVELRFVPAGD